MDDLLSDFITECLDGLAMLDVALVKLERDPGDRELVAGIFRAFHSMKATCGFLGLPRLGRVAHAAEGVLDRLRDGGLAATPAVVDGVLAAVDRVRLILEGLAAGQAESAGDDGDLIERLARIAAGDEAPAEGPPSAAAEPRPSVPAPVPEAGAWADAGRGGPGTAAEAVAAQTVRVRVDLLERLADLAGELALTRDQLLRLAREIDRAGGLDAPLRRLGLIAAELQEGVARARLQPIGNAWRRLPRLVRDLGRELGKRIDLRLGGADTELDRRVLELIKDPLTHLIRNAADHGIEAPEERRAAGKPEHGVVRLDASREAGHVVVRVGDDGRGLDADRIRARALAGRLATEQELAAMGPERVSRLIFRAGFSTADRVSGVSGRGVGMDVVATSIERIGGTIELASERGRGTTFTIKVPLGPRPRPS